MNCLHCHKPIVLIPSVAERVRKFGGKPEDYIATFQYHAVCTLELRAESVAELMKHIKENHELHTSRESYARHPIYFPMDSTQARR